jgi:hypothetical protein
MSRNPLKNLDSDERIQGNPKDPKAQKRGFSKPNGQNPENPNGAVWQEHVALGSNRPTSLRA